MSIQEIKFVVKSEPDCLECRRKVNLLTGLTWACWQCMYPRRSSFTHIMDLCPDALDRTVYRQRWSAWLLGRCESRSAHDDGDRGCFSPKGWMHRGSKWEFKAANKIRCSGAAKGNYTLLLNDVLLTITSDLRCREFLVEDARTLGK